MLFFFFFESLVPVTFHINTPLKKRRDAYRDQKKIICEFLIFIYFCIYEIISRSSLSREFTQYWNEYRALVRYVGGSEELRK